jgi:phosphoglycerate dehydrogenase-like enzyme
MQGRGMTQDQNRAFVADQAARSGPVVFYGLSDTELPQFERHEAHPVLIRKLKDQPIWLPPAEAEVMFSFIGAWRNAPKTAPAGWPFNIRYIQLASAGVDALPDWAWDGPIVACARGITAEPIAEYVMAAIFRDIKRFDDMVGRDEVHFASIADEHRWPKDTLTAIRGQTLGLVGYGAIGQAIARRAQAMGMVIKALRHSGNDGSGLFVDSIQELAAQSDQLVLCAPATPQTRHIIDADVLATCKPGTHLINVARGSLVDHEALREVLQSGRLRHATLDVTEPEPLPKGHPFYASPRVTLTPHVAWFSADHHERLTKKLLANLSAWGSGEPLADVAERGKGY